MTNGEKYQTIKERRKAFKAFCWERHNFCLGCPYFPYQIGDVCFDYWLNAEADEEVTKESNNVDIESNNLHVDSNS